MAGKYPLAFSSTSTYGTTTSNENPFYYIHNSSNLSIYSNADTAFDVYTFSEDPSDSDAPQQSYTLVIVKNIGAAGSELMVNSLTLDFPQEDVIPNPFSFVRQISDVTISTLTSAIKSPTDFAALTTGVSGESITNSSLNQAANGSRPIFYLKIDIDTVTESENEVGGVQETSFDGTAKRYIPIYDPANGVGEGGMLAHGDTDFGISAKQESGVTYPEYAAFMIKCDPVGEMDITDATLNFEFNTGNQVTFELHITAYRTGDLAYKQGYFNTSNGAWTDANSITPNLTVKTPVELSVDWTPVTNETGIAIGFESDQFINHPKTGGEGAVININAFDSSATFNNIYGNFMPYNYHVDSKAHIGADASDNIDYSDFYVKIYDSTTNTGGVRLLGPSGSTVNALMKLNSNNTAQSNTTKYNFSGFPINTSNDYLLQYLATPAYSTNSDVFLGSGGVTGARNRTLEEGETVYARIRKFGDYNNANYRNTLLHPNTADHFANTTFASMNRRTYVAGVPSFYNPFWISDAAAENGENDEVTHRDTLYFLQGDYFVWSTDVPTASKYCRLGSLGTGNSALVNAHASFGQVDRFTGTFISENVSGTIASPDSVYKDATGHSAQKANAAEVLNAGGITGKTTIYKHKHIYDQFILGGQDGTQITISDVKIQFNNLSGYDHFYCDAFDWTETQVNTTYNVFSTSGETGGTGVLAKKIIESTNENFFPYGVGGHDGTNLHLAFSKDSSVVPWTNLTDNMYPDGAKCKELTCGVRYSTPMVDNYPTWDGFSDPAAGTTEDYLNFDPLGRQTETTEIKLYQTAINAANGSNADITKKWVGIDCVNEHLTFHFSAKRRNSAFYGLDFSAGGAHPPNNVVAEYLYVTEYVPAGILGSETYAIDSSTTPPSRTACNANMMNAVCQESASSTSVTGMENYLAINHTYASTTESDNYYHRKLPLNGKMCFKHERYFYNSGGNSGPIAGFVNTQGSEYGMLPGPLSEGRFMGSTPQHGKSGGVSGNPLSSGPRMILRQTCDELNENNDRYECFLHFNIANQYDTPATIISIDLENKVGTAGRPSGSQVGGSLAASFGDPRYIAGSAANGVYKTALHVAQAEKTWSAPHVNGGDDATYLVTLVLSSNTLASHAESTAIIDNMIITQADGGTNFIPAGSRVKIHNATNIKLVNDAGEDVSFAQSSGVVDVILDYPKPEYVIWDIVSIKPTANSDGTSGNNYSALESTSQTPVWDNSEAAALGTKPDRHYYDNFQWNTNNSVSPTALSNDTSNYYSFNPILNGVANDSSSTTYDSQSYYGGAAGGEDGGGRYPCIYFAIDNTALKDQRNNELSSGLYINRLRIRYILHDKLDAYGVNQVGVGVDSLEGYHMGDGLDKLPVYEDTYLVAVDFSNKTPEAIVSDVENNTNFDETVINFGTLSTG